MDNNNTYYVVGLELGNITLGDSEHAVRKMLAMEFMPDDRLYAMDGLMGRVRNEDHVDKVFKQRQRG